VCDSSDQAGDCGSERGILRNHPASARILRRWRELTGGKVVRDSDRRTVVACSGGADSVALAVVLACVEPKPTLVHVVHDIRDDGSAEVDRDAVKGLAVQLGCQFDERSVLVKALGGNLESNAREARYAALCDMAAKAGAGYIATGHHSDDQLETVLMNLIRGSGVRGMSGVSPKREMGTVHVVRPMLEVTREEIEVLCGLAGASWQHDHTNDDEGYLRNRVRHSVIPVLKEVEPDIALRASGLARSSRETSEVLGNLIDDQIASAAVRKGTEWAWEREFLRVQPAACLGELLFVYVREVLSGVGADSIGRRAIDGVIRGIKSDATDPRVHRVGPIVVHVRAREVVISDT